MELRIQDLAGLASPMGLAGIAGKLLQGPLKDQALRFIRGKLDSQAGRSAAKEVARVQFKGIGIAMSPDGGLDLAQRTTLGTQLARQLALAHVDAGRAVILYADAQAAAEAVRGVDGKITGSALLRREAAEELLAQAELNIARISNGQDPKPLEDLKKAAAGD